MVAVAEEAVAFTELTGEADTKTLEETTTVALAEFGGSPSDGVEVTETAELDTVMERVPLIEADGKSADATLLDWESVVLFVATGATAEELNVTLAVLKGMLTLVGAVG